MATVAVFDINETTLDLGPVRSAVGEVMGRPDGFGLWFGRLLQTSMAVTATGEFADFGTLAESALDSVAQSSSIDLPDDGWERVKAAMGVLQPYPDVVHGLESLAEQGWRLVALTNSAQGSVDAQLRGCGLYDRFEEVLSVDSVRAFKPAAAPYHLALETARVEPAEAVMVAAHDWDLAGAKAVGMETTFVARVGMPFSSAYPSADYTVVDFGELTRVLGAPG